MFYHLNTPTFLYISFWVIMWCPVIFEGKFVAVNFSSYNDIDKFYHLIPMLPFRSMYRIIDIVIPKPTMNYSISHDAFEALSQQFVLCREQQANTNFYFLLELWWLLNLGECACYCEIFCSWPPLTGNYSQQNTLEIMIYVEWDENQNM